MNFVNNLTNETQIDIIFSKFLRICEFFSLFSARLRFKIDVFVMLLRNMYSKQKLCNNIRLIITIVKRFVLKICIFDNFMNEQIRLISRILITNIFENLFWIVQRKQFFIRLCFAMIVNKFQNQSLNIVKIDLRLSIFFTNNCMLFYRELRTSTNCLYCFRKTETIKQWM